LFEIGALRHFDGAIIDKAISKPVVFFINMCVFCGFLYSFGAYFFDFGFLEFLDVFLGTSVVFVCSLLVRVLMLEVKYG